MVFNPPKRTLMGPGPSETHPQVLAALAAPTIGHLDPQFLKVMDRIKSGLQKIFKTKNEMTFPVSGTGSAGMECCLVNVLEPGDRVVIAQNGVFGGRMADIVNRLGAELVHVEVPYGQTIPTDLVVEAIAGKPTKLVGIVHAETSTGVAQPLKEISAAAHSVGALFLVDCVTSLGGMEVAVDDWGIDLAYSGTQKCLSCPPGLSPVTFSERAVAALKARKSKVVSWYLDLSLLLNYWGGERVYHHTAPINMLYGLEAALNQFFEEGEQAVFQRHLSNHYALVAGLEAMGLSMLVPPANRLPQLNTVVIPEGVSDTAVRTALLDRYDIEIGGGLGSLQGKVWRIGLMGYTSRMDNVVRVLAALESVLGEQGLAIESGAGIKAAKAVNP